MKSLFFLVTSPICEAISREKRTMTRLKAALAAGATAVTLMVLPGGAAPAEAAAWCAYAGGREAYENCGYYTFEQCRAAVRGVGGDCRPNPYERWGRGPAYYDDEPPPPPPRRRVRRYYD
jgi:hypothetical protein